MSFSPENFTPTDKIILIYAIIVITTGTQHPCLLAKNELSIYVKTNKQATE